ncbi:Lactose transport system permease protein LacF [Microbacterium sp. Bi98]|uniref:carbohydrate ABC transporter permease n=1 Tax=unclassified Microbacterium TaxID=2609290 RepID=UPI0007000FF4|nr:MULTISPECIES: sugar ABC transporter permease [unclassified Microbacterium]KRD50533.1 ABC transporter permease [Microbacterium sp. Root280D1]CAH0145266.1 Lactose transport system permease protein LacF [Microbacterium sp. Bi98]
MSLLHEAEQPAPARERTPRPRQGAASARNGRDLNGAARFRPAWVPWLWLIAPIGVITAFYLYPFANILFLSFTDASPLSGRGAFVGLENYVFLVNDPGFWNAVGNSLVYAICVVPLMVILPLLLALLLKDKVPGIGVFRALFYIPAISSLVVVSLAWTALLKDDGAINNLMIDLNLIDDPLPFLTGRWFLLFSAMAVTIWQGLPYYMILYLAALSNVDRSLYEAAAMDGAGPVRRFFTVTVPGVRVMLSLVGILSMIGSIKIFTEVYLLSNGSGGIGGQSETLTMYIRAVGLDPTYGSLGQGAAGSVFLFLLTLGLLLMSQRLNRKAEEQ